MWPAVITLGKSPSLAALVLFLTLGFHTGAGQPITATEDGFPDRQAAVLQDLASRYDPGYTGYLTGHRRNFGVHSTYLLAAIEVNRRGLGEGVSLEEAMPRIEEMLQHARENLGEWDAMPLNPGMRMAAHVFPYIFHQWHDQLSHAARRDIRWLMTESPWKDHQVSWLVNGSVWAGKLLVGEREGYESALWKSAVSELDVIYERTMTVGGLELNAPIYSSYHYAPLAFLADKLEHEEVRTKVRILLDYLLIVAGHQYIPGGNGFVGLPRMRQREGIYAGSARLPQHFHLFFGEPATNFADNFSPQMITAAADYRPPAIIGSFFREKPESGYEFWTYSDSPFGTGRMGASKTYALIPGSNLRVSPWHVMMMPDGEGMMGIAYGHRGFTHHVSMGAFVRDGQSRFHGIYQYHPVVRGDTYNNGNGLAGFEPPDDDPDDWRDEGYDYERFLWGRTLLSIWDPTLHGKASNVVRTYRDTRARIPNLARFGGEMIRHGRWYLGRMGNTYIAYFPLGQIRQEESRDGGDWFYVRLNGRSGCIIEMATTEDFPSLQAYAENLSERHLSMDISPTNFHVIFDARDPNSGKLVRLRLNYDPEQRFIGEREVTMQEYDRGFMDSPWVDWDASRRVKTVRREGYKTLIYDVKNVAISEVSEGNADAAGRVLILVEAGHAQEASVRAMGGWLQSQEPEQYDVDYSADLSPNVLHSATSLTAEQMNLLNTYDLIIMPRIGAGPSANFASTDWNLVTTPILNMNPFSYRPGTAWGWVNTADSITHPRPQQMVILEAANPLFEGVDTSGGSALIYRDGSTTTMTSVADSSVLTGTTVGWTDHESGGINHRHPWLTTWTGDEGRFYDDGQEARGGPRTLLLAPNNNSVTDYTAAGQRILLNAVAQTLAAGRPPPASAPYRDWMAAHFSEADQIDKSISGPRADVAGDGVPNLIKYVLGLPPHSDSRPFLPEPSIDEADTEDYLTLKVRRLDPLDDASLHVDVSNDLFDWSEPARLVQEIPLAPGKIEAIYRDPNPVGGLPRRFMRMRVEWHGE